MEIAWSEILLNKILVVVSVSLFLIEFKDIFRLMPQLIYSLDRPKGGLSFEHNVSTSRSRNLIALSCIIPVGLILDKFHIFSPDFWARLNAQWSALVGIGIVCSYGILRQTLYIAIKPKRSDNVKRTALKRSPYSFFIMLTILMLITSFIMSFIDVEASLCRNIFLLEIGLCFLFCCIRNMQILSSFCSFLEAFLYLCAFEIMPAAILVASAMFL